MWRSTCFNLLAVLTGAITLLATESAMACAVCFDADESTRSAYYGITLFLSLFPAVLIALLGWWVYRILTVKRSD